MSEKTKMYEFRAQWKYIHLGGVYQKDFLATSVSSLLYLLNKSEGVNSASVEHLYIHDVTDGKPFECVTFDMGSGDGTITYSEREGNNVPSNVVPIGTAMSKKERRKLRVKLKNQPAPAPPVHTTVCMGFYKVMEMPDVQSSN